MKPTRAGSYTRLALLGALLLAAIAEAAPQQAKDFDWRLPPGFPVPRVPADNPMNAHKVEMGRRLFYDVRLSGAAGTACASCHRQELAFTDGRARARGAEGDLHPRSAMSLANVVYAPALGWADPDTRSLEAQAAIPMFNRQPVEMGVAGVEEHVLARLRADSDYRRLFAAAFPEATGTLALLHVRRALAAFQRTLISGDSAYDRLVYRDDAAAMGPQARRGMRLFFSERAGCAKCHAGPGFSGPMDFEGAARAEAQFHNTGLYNLEGRGRYPQGGQGVFEHTGRTEDVGRFRTPTLRNVALTAPYMHDGSVPSLRAAVLHYAAGGRNWRDAGGSGRAAANPHQSEDVREIGFDETEVDALVAFLESLTDWAFVSDPRFANPFGPAPAARAPSAAIRNAR